jgi:8-oxo-dGTP pyrophosphatase MutT (NUDIX family)
MEKFSNFLIQIANKLAQELPGADSQLKMVPITRQIELEKRKNTSLPKESAVLILFYPNNNEIYVAFIKRQSYDGVHSGQIAFPGGKHEESDSSLIQTALREAEEEIGIKQKKVKIHGQLSNIYIPPSNFNVLPVIGSINSRPEFKLDPLEVDDIIEITLSQLLNPKNNQNKDILRPNQLRVNVPCYYINGHIIWGATAMIISELIDVINS